MEWQNYGQISAAKQIVRPDKCGRRHHAVAGGFQNVDDNSKIQMVVLKAQHEATIGRRLDGKHANPIHVALRLATGLQEERRDNGVAQGQQSTDPDRRPGEHLSPGVPGFQVGPCDRNPVGVHELGAGKQFNDPRRRIDRLGLSRVDNLVPCAEPERSCSPGV